MSKDKLAKLVRKLLRDESPNSARKLREKFYDDPESVMSNPGNGDPSKRQKARLYTMDRRTLAIASGEWDLVEGYDMEHDWPKQGEDLELQPDDSRAWPKDSDSRWRNATQLSDTCDGVLDVGAVSPPDVTRGGWGDPGPHGRGFRLAVHKKGTGFKLDLVGEGYLSTAQIEIHKKGDPAPYRPPVNVERILCENFQRVYLKTEELQIDEEGAYQVFVRNHMCFDDRIPAGQLLRIVP